MKKLKIDKNDTEFITSLGITMKRGEELAQKTFTDVLSGKSPQMILVESNEDDSISMEEFAIIIFLIGMVINEQLREEMVNENN